jgi:hypothetical protein
MKLDRTGQHMLAELQWDGPVRKRGNPVGLILLLAAGAAPGAAWGQGSLEACAQVNDDAQRLACYDQLAGRAMTGTEVAVSPLPAAVAAPRAAAAAPPVAAVPVAVDPVADFGLSEQVKKQREPEQWVESVTARVTNVGMTAYDRYVITLDNGQVWAQSETSTRAILAPGDTVTIKRAAMGSFKLSGPRSVYWRVRRLQ